MRPLICIVLTCVCTGPAVAQTRAIDVEHSTMTVRVFKSGLFSAFGHNHEIRAPLAAGTVNQQSPAVELSVKAGDLRVIDTDVSDKDRAEIQSTMSGPKVLDAAQFPEIRFRSTRVESQGPQKWLLTGDLTLHGTTHPVAVQVTGDGGRYRGQATVSQRDFGITPVKVAGGTVSVKNEVRVEFDIAFK